MTSPGTLSEAPTDEIHEPESDVETAAELEDELLVEEISIDGMCGVY